MKPYSIQSNVQLNILNVDGYSRYKPEDTKMLTGKSYYIESVRGNICHFMHDELFSIAHAILNENIDRLITTHKFHDNLDSQQSKKYYSDLEDMWCGCMLRCITRGIQCYNINADSPIRRNNNRVIIEKSKDVCTPSFDYMYRSEQFPRSSKYINMFPENPYKLILPYIRNCVVDHIDKHDNNHYAIIHNDTYRGRKIINIEKLIQAIESVCNVIVLNDIDCLSKMSIREQFTLIHNADYVITSHGSFLTNAVYMKSESILISLLPEEFGGSAWNEGIHTHIESYLDVTCYSVWCKSHMDTYRYKIEQERSGYGVQSLDTYVDTDHIVSLIKNKPKIENKVHLDTSKTYEK